MTQLTLLDDRLQAELAQAPHWREPRTKIRTTQRRPRIDYAAWLAHAAECEDCATARDDLVNLRGGGIEWEPAAPCSVGMRLVPLADVDQAADAISRENAGLLLRRLIDHARRLDGWGPEANMSAGQAWGRLA